MTKFLDQISGEVRELNYHGIKCKREPEVEVPMVTYFMPDSRPAMCIVRRNPPQASSLAWDFVGGAPGGFLLVPHDTDYVASNFDAEHGRLVMDYEQLP